MHRSIVQPGQLPLEGDILATNKHALVSHGVLAQAILGTGTLVDGLAIAPTSPTSMSLVIGPGSIYQQATIDATAYGTLAADTRTIVKEGIALNPDTRTFVAPTTTGYAQNILVQAQYQDSDGDPALRPYFNSSNPAVPLQGPGNNGQPDNTTRKGLVALALKAGIAATSGSQVTPTPDVGYVGLYVVTVSAGQTAIASGNISVYPGAPFVPVKLPQVPAAAQREDFSYAQGTGSASALLAALTPPPAALVAGMRVSIRSPFTNTGATTLNLNGLGVKAVVARDNTDLKPGDIVNGSIIDLRYNGASWQLLSDRSTTLSFSISDNSLWHYGSATGGTATALTTTLSPAASAAVAGLCFRVPITATNGANATIDFGFGAKPIVDNKTSLGAIGGEMPGGVGYDADFIYDGTNARHLNPLAPPSDLPPRNLWSRNAAGTYTFTVPPKVFWVYGTVVGGGGGGAGGNGPSPSTTGGGGGAGGTAAGWIAVAPGQNIPVVVGAGGGGGNPIPQQAGGNGGSSSAGGMTGTGGGGGSNVSSAPAGGAGGDGSGGQVNQPGGNGGDGSGSTNIPGGNGGASSQGGGGRTSTLGPGVSSAPNGRASGSGGGGIWGSGYSGGAQFGGNGAPGLVSFGY